MQTFRVELGPASHPVYVGNAILDRLGELSRAAGIKPGPVALVTDSNVARHYSAHAAGALEKSGFIPKLMVVPAGEASKSSAVLQDLYDQMIGAEIDRGGSIFALGGGVVGDLGGFAAASYLRGIAVVQVPTTLLAMVDSSVGGKTGVNVSRGKNLVGAFHQPRLVWVDAATLATLPPRELRAGLAEVVKHAVIRDAALFAALESDAEALLTGGPERFVPLLERNCAIKAEVVARDERESGLRMILNFGHTLAHAIEALARYRGVLHGEAVAMGMSFAARRSEALGLAPPGTSGRLVALLARLGLPTELPAHPRRAYLAALSVDKKKRDAHVRFVALREIGRAETVALLPREIFPSEAR